MPFQDKANPLALLKYGVEVLLTLLFMEVNRRMRTIPSQGKNGSGAG
jgi:hypothetical protein